MEWIKKNQFILSFLSGILLSLACYLFNPFALDAGANKAVAVAVLMITWWIAEAMPMPAVALIPLVLHPLFNIGTIEETSKAYSNPVIFLFMGGFMIGLAIEKWNLHKRIALHIVKRTGTSGDRIILGFILATGFLSMWLSNTATTMMMFPIALSVIAVMKEHQQPGTSIMNFSMVLMLVIAYASNIGGMATIIGTPPNVAFVGYIEKKYNYTVQFIDWMLVCTPLAVLLLAALYWVLAKWLFPSRIKNSTEANNYINDEINALGKLSPTEKRVLIIFVTTALLWITKDLLNQLNWFKLDDNMIAIFGALALFATPSGIKKENKPLMILEWADTSKMAWGILLLFGGGIALANSLEKAGVMAQVGNWLAGFSHINGLGLVLMIVLISIFLSEVMSNVAQVIVLSPVLASLADALHLDPLLLGIPMTLAASAAAMMPMGTPPNAIVFSSGHIKLKDMIRAGFAMNIISIILITLFCWFVLPMVMGVVMKR
ncbi:MAG: DASS family sodium-coupled anion symporter [Chitinophagaceae bacterium]|jgi:solute carrier family 13 (sodium-dependent dicarboxylate transporter), member 2/3/5|nr:DASS family sodium-coupled anion symporter [Chitinophagaceae bacterium]